MKWNSSVTAWIHNKWHHAVAWSVDVNRLWKPSQTAVSNAEFSRIPTALCHLLLSLHITTACVHCCLDTAQPQPQELEIVNKKRRAVLTSQSWPAPNGQLIVVESLWELVALLQQQTTERGKSKNSADSLELENLQRGEAENLKSLRQDQIGSWLNWGGRFGS